MNEARLPEDSARVPRDAIIAMVVILAVTALVSVHAHIERVRQDKIETAIVTPAKAP